MSPMTRDTPASPAAPGPLRWSHRLSLAAAVIMILSGLVALTQGDAGDPNATAEVLEAFRRNLRFLGIFNIVAGLLIAGLAPLLLAGRRYARRIMAPLLGVAIFMNTAGFAIQVAGGGMVLIVLLLAVVLVLMFRRSSGSFIAQTESGRD